MPNGAYDVIVDFGESVVRTDLGGTGAGDVRCEVEHVPACLDHGVGAGNDACVFDGPVDVTDGKFSVTGYSHDTGACHSISKVTIEYIGPVGAGAGCDSPTTEAECGVAVDAAGLSRGGCGYPFTGDWGATRGCYTYPTGADTEEYLQRLRPRPPRDLQHHNLMSQWCLGLLLLYRLGFGRRLVN